MKIFYDVVFCENQGTRKSCLHYNFVKICIKDLMNIEKYNTVRVMEFWAFFPLIFQMFVFYKNVVCVCVCEKVCEDRERK